MLSREGDEQMATADLRVIKSQRAIHKAFNELVAQEGFERLTVRRLCAEALIGRSTFYRYYQDKYDLLTQLVDQATRQLDQLLQRRLAHDQLDTLLTTLYQSLAIHRETLLTLLSIERPEGNLRQAWTMVLERRLTKYLQGLPGPVPIDFLGQLYAVNVLTALTWSLQNGVTPEITTFMNQLFHSARQAYFPA